MDANDATLQRLAERVLEARRTKTPLDIHGGGTKRFYGNPPRGEALDVSGLAGITCYEPTELYVTALAGTRLTELEAVLAERGQCLPFEPPHYGAAGTLGGMIAAGLSGPGRASTGPVRDFVLGMTLLNGRGEVLTFGGQVMKNVAGYDVSRVMAGSMGILGVICEVSVKVMPKAAAVRTLCLEAEQAAALARVSAWLREGLPVTASSWYAGRLMVRLGGANAAVARASWGVEVDPQEAARWWSAVRDHRHEFFTLSDAELARGECLWRLSLPDAVGPLALAGRPFLEWGGTQRWYRGSAAGLEMRAAAAAAGGHATLFRAADKSLGAFTRPSAPLMEIHRRLKHAFDPDGILNPGRLYPEI